MMEGKKVFASYTPQNQLRNCSSMTVGGVVLARVISGVHTVRKPARVCSGFSRTETRVQGLAEAMSLWPQEAKIFLLFDRIDIHGFGLAALLNTQLESTKHCLAEAGNWNYYRVRTCLTVVISTSQWPVATCQHCHQMLTETKGLEWWTFVIWKQSRLASLNFVS